MNLSQLTVEEFTSPTSESVPANTKISEVWKKMKTKGIRHLLITDPSQTVVGIISERDLTTFSQSPEFDSILAEDIMSKDLVVTTPDTRLYEVALKMSQDKIGSTLVFDASDNSYGIFTATDALNALVEVLRGDLDQ